MRIRVEGTESEITAAVQLIDTVLKVSEVSDFYPNRQRGAKYLPPTVNAPKQGRVYLDLAVPPSSTVVQAEAERADQPRHPLYLPATTMLRDFPPTTTTTED